jgi:hypothetical protein
VLIPSPFPSFLQRSPNNFHVVTNAAGSEAARAARQVAVKPDGLRRTAMEGESHFMSVASQCR